MNRTSIIEKIKALLTKTKANGATEAEMMSALDKASAMMDAYDITEADVQVAKDEFGNVARRSAGSERPAQDQVATDRQRQRVLRRADIPLAP